tara:strand:- start:254 stop:1168 length:915 start_codon:yes stop_codon:yes gene_type:complete
MANTWNQSGTTWSTGRWGTTDPIVSGWGAKSYNEPGTTWNNLTDQQVNLTSPGAITASLGTTSITTEINKGWGQDTWGNETWGESGMLVELTGPDAMQSNVGASGWNGAAWGQGQGWGIFTLNPADVMGLTGVSATGSVGSPTIIGSVEFSLTGVSATLSVGSISPTEQAIGLTGQAITSAVGTLAPADVMGVTGVSATFGVGEISINSSPIVDLSGQALTSSVGSLTPADVMGLTGVSATSSVGSLSPADVMGLTGVTATASVAGFGTAAGFGIQAYQAVDTGSNSSYTNVATGSNTSYSDAA